MRAIPVLHGPRGVQKRGRVLVLTASLVAMSGCIMDQPPTAPIAGSRNGAAKELAAAVGGRNSRGFEDVILRMETHLPGLGGIFVRDGRAVVYLKDFADENTARADIARARSQSAALDRLQRQAGFQSIEIRRGQYAFSELVNWTNVLAASLSGIQGVSTIDADEAENRVRLGVLSETARSNVERAVLQARVPLEAVRIAIEGSVSSLTSIRDIFRPHIPGGVQLAYGPWQDYAFGPIWDGICTIGFNVTNASGEKGFLTAAHCMPPSQKGSGSTGGNIFQNTTVNNAVRIGYVAMNVPWTPAVSCPNTSYRCTSADVMFVKYDNTSNWLTELVHVAGSPATNSAGGSISSVSGWYNNIQIGASAGVGTTVDKIGRTTGWTTGVVSGTCVDILSDSSQTSAHYLNCMTQVSNAGVGQGDSGAGVFIRPTVSGGVVYALGILAAGGVLNTAPDHADGDIIRCDSSCKFYYTPWGAIQSALGSMATH
jgi:hypothetical protein